MFSVTWWFAPSTPIQSLGCSDGPLNPAFEKLTLNNLHKRIILNMGPSVGQHCQASRCTRRHVPATFGTTFCKIGGVVDTQEPFKKWGQKRRLLLNGCPFSAPEPPLRQNGQLNHRLIIGVCLIYGVTWQFTSQIRNFIYISPDEAHIPVSSIVNTTTFENI